MRSLQWSLCSYHIYIYLYIYTGASVMVGAAEIWRGFRANEAARASVLTSSVFCRWSRREESDFYRILAAFGVELDQESGNYNWTNFKKLAKLERKYDHRMQEFYEHYRVMCLKVCKRDDEIPADYGKHNADQKAHPYRPHPPNYPLPPPTFQLPLSHHDDIYLCHFLRVSTRGETFWLSSFTFAAQKPPLDFQIEAISEERASKCLQRIDLLLKVRSEVLPHPKLEERLKLCQKSVELPEWWQPGKHDNDLLLGVSRWDCLGIEMNKTNRCLSWKENKWEKSLIQ